VAQYFGRNLGGCQTFGRNFRRQICPAKKLALGAYFNFLVNLRFFPTDDEREDTDEEVEEKELTFDDLQLSELGSQRLARHWVENFQTNLAIPKSQICLGSSESAIQP
jgi:hypothetical protein